MSSSSVTSSKSIHWLVWHLNATVSRTASTLSLQTFASLHQSLGMNSLVVTQRQSLEPPLHPDHHRLQRRYEEEVARSDATSLLYDKVGRSVRLRPTAPAGFRRALRQEAHKVQELTLLGFSESAVAEELYQLIVQGGRMPLQTLRIVSLDLWSATHLQSTTALAVGPALAQLVVVPHLCVLHLQRVSMGRTPAHVQALAQALSRHPALQVLCMDVHSHQLKSATATTTTSQPSGGIVNLDPLMKALATCSQLHTLQIYLSGYQRGCLYQCDSALAVLVSRLQELSLHMVSLPRASSSSSSSWIKAVCQSTTLQVLHWTHGHQQEQFQIDWANTIILGNASLQSISLSIPSNNRVQCWKAIANHPKLTSVSLSLGQSLKQVPAFRGSSRKSTAWTDVPVERMDAQELAAMAQSLSSNPRLVQVYHHASHVFVQALVTLNQGPRSWYLSCQSRWWNFVFCHADDLETLYLLVRLYPQCMSH